MKNNERYIIKLKPAESYYEHEYYKDGTGVITLRPDIAQWLDENVPERNWSWQLRCQPQTRLVPYGSSVEVSIRDKTAATQFKLIYGGG
jgi:hypothetical protein